ncbi:hypothetical protein LX32DRAFT_404011 [Colletotrichum zoysiae]|uniref:Uncharacterized protein n=1 Tax=Colletotrichum zoysiae TaxID=1216348 RepID=A0AAD9M4P0_9PEZI|nr:hypothetical protein LX32DRAFT_404011 [Colletotrichum zoysiae]
MDGQLRAPVLGAWRTPFRCLCRSHSSSATAVPDGFLANGVLHRLHWLTSLTRSWVSSALESSAGDALQMMLDRGLVGEAKHVTYAWMEIWIS